MIKLMVIGNLGKDCIVNTVNGKNVINFNIAHTEKFKDSTGAQREKTTCPAAVSHSIVGARRGYTLAFPSATRHNLIELPELMQSTSPNCCLFKSINCSVSAVLWLRLATTV